MTSAPTVSPTESEEAKICSNAITECAKKLNITQAAIKAAEQGKGCPEGSSSGSGSVIIGIILALLGIFCPAYLIFKERAGTPMFGKGNGSASKKRGIEMHGGSMAGFGNGYDNGAEEDSSFIDHQERQK